MGIDVKQTFDQPYVLVLLTSSPQGMRSGSLVGAFVGICVGITLFYTVVLLVLICALILWNKRHTGILQVCTLVKFLCIASFPGLPHLQFLIACSSETSGEEIT